MSNDIKTHRLIVTLPDMSGEEADSIASDLEDYLTEQSRHDVVSDDATVTHALGESLPEAFPVARVAGLPHLQYVDLRTEGGEEIALSPLEARQLAGVLLAHAETIEAAESVEAGR